MSGRLATVAAAGQSCAVRVAAVTCFSKPPLSTDLSADVLEKLTGWRPPVWATYPDGGDLEALALPLLRCWVAAARPGSVSLTLRMLRATSEFTMWAYDTSGVVDARLLSPTNVEYWVNQVNADRPKTWRDSKRYMLRRVARAAFPGGWIQPGEPVGKRVPAVPYTAGDETVFRISACLPSRAEPAGRRWVVAATLGAGLLGPVIAAATTDDVIELGDNRLGIQVRGKHSRVVPIRADYTPLLAEAMELVGDGRFVTATHRTAVYMLCRQVGFDGKGLSVRRARSTWLVAHLHAATPLSVLRRIAGPLSGDTLTALMASSAADLDAVDAASRGLGP